MFAHANPPHGSDDVHLTRRSTDLQTSYELCMCVCVCVLKGIGEMPNVLLDVLNFHHKRGLDA